MVQLFSHLILLFDKFIYAIFQVFAHHALQAIAIKANEVGKQLVAQHGGSRLSFALTDDLQQHVVGNICRVSRIDHRKHFTVDYHRPDMLERNVGA